MGAIRSADLRCDQFCQRRFAQKHDLTVRPAENNKAPVKALYQFESLAGKGILNPQRARGKCRP
jgi:hypothetical protein